MYVCVRICICICEYDTRVCMHIYSCIVLAVGHGDDPCRPRRSVQDLLIQRRRLEEEFSGLGAIVFEGNPFRLLGRMAWNSSILSFRCDGTGSDSSKVG